MINNKIMFSKEYFFVKILGSVSSQAAKKIMFSKEYFFVKNFSKNAHRSGFCIKSGCKKKFFKRIFFCKKFFKKCTPA